MAATVDDISGGRLVLGLGAGWNETEYRAFGLPYDHRVSRFEESFEIVRRLVAGERVTLDGRFWSADDLVLLPPPARRIPLMIGSNGAADALDRAPARGLVEHVVRPPRQHGRGLRRAERVGSRGGRAGGPRPGRDRAQHRCAGGARPGGGQAAPLGRGIAAGRRSTACRPIWRRWPRPAQTRRS